MKALNTGRLTVTKGAAEAVVAIVSLIFAGQTIKTGRDMIKAEKKAKN